MSIVLLSARLLLSAVFNVAGITKLADLSGSRRAMIGFGIPKNFAAPVALALPLAEILIALALIPLSSAWVAAVAAAGLLSVFVIAIAVNLARGRTPDCHCFGQLHSEPVGRSTLIRNVGLIVVAGFIVAAGRNDAGVNALSWLSDLKVGEVVTLTFSVVAVGMLAITFVYLRRVINQHSILLERIEVMKRVIDEDYAEPPVERAEAVAPGEGLLIGALAPQFNLESIEGGNVSLDDLLGYGKPVLLLFVSPNCFPCESLFPLVKEWERDYRAELTIALLSKGSVKENLRIADEYGTASLLVQGDTKISDVYQVKWTPAAVLITAHARIAGHFSYGVDEIKELVSEAVAGTTAQAIDNGGSGKRKTIQIGDRSSYNVGDFAPEFTVTDGEGRLIKSSDFLGQDTALLFWNPGCPFCQEMSDDLISWEENPPKNAPHLVIVASGDEEILEADSKRFISRYMRDPDLDVGELFGTKSTPSAVIIGRDGRIASTIAFGPETWALLGARKAKLPVVSVS